MNFAVVNMHKSVPDNAGNSEQVEIPAGLDRIKNHCYNFKMEVGQFLQPLKWLVSLPRLS